MTNSTPTFAEMEAAAARAHIAQYAEFGDIYATAREIEDILSDPLAYYEMVEMQVRIETGHRIDKWDRTVVECDELDMRDANNHASGEDAYRAKNPDRIAAARPDASDVAKIAAKAGVDLTFVCDASRAINRMLYRQALVNIIRAVQEDATPELIATMILRLPYEIQPSVARTVEGSAYPGTFAAKVFDILDASCL